MKKVIRGFIITAVVMIIVGIALCVGGAFAGGISATQSVVRDMVEDGDFEFEGIIKGDCDLDCGMGNVIIEF